MHGAVNAPNEQIDKDYWGLAAWIATLPVDKVDWGVWCSVLTPSSPVPRRQTIRRRTDSEQRIAPICTHSERLSTFRDRDQNVNFSPRRSTGMEAARRFVRRSRNRSAMFLPTE